MMYLLEISGCSLFYIIEVTCLNLDTGLLTPTAPHHKIHKMLRVDRQR